MAAPVLNAKTLRLRIELEHNDKTYSGKKKLKLCGKDLMRLPMSLFHLVELEILELSPEREACLDYKLFHLPREIGQLTSLIVLNLDTNELPGLPEEICLLKQLQALILSNNFLGALPSHFSDLSNLTTLHLAHNRIGVFPNQLCKMEALEFLDLSDNMIEELPEDIAQMKTLDTLLLFMNRLLSLPDSFCCLINLRCLWLGNNKLGSLPKDFGKLECLEWGIFYTSSAIDGNPLEYPPLDICRQGVSVIHRYMNGEMSDLNIEDIISREGTVHSED